MNNHERVDATLNGRASGRASKTLAVMAIGAILAAMNISSPAATLAWGAPAVFTNANQVSTAGTSVSAVNEGNGAAAVVVNGIYFAASGTIGNSQWSNPAAYTNAAIAGMTLADTDALLQYWSIGAGSGSVTVSGLTVGQTYLFQIVTVDQRFAAPGYKMTFGSAGNSAYLGTPYVVNVTFTADATSQSIGPLTYNGANDYILTAWQVRNVTPLPGITNALAGYWKFDETSGTTAADASGNGNSGVVHNANADGGQWTSGKVGGALRFRGAGLGDDYVTVSNWPGLLNGIVSLSAWILMDTNQTESLIGNVQSSSQTITMGQESAPLPVSAWQHVVMVADGSHVTVYRNGIQTGYGSYDGTFYNLAAALIIGAQMTNGVSPNTLWQGKIDEVACWSRALNPDEVFELFAAGANGQPVLQANNFSNSPPVLAASVQGASVYANGALSLQASVAGFGPLIYQWLLNGTPLANGTNSSYANSSTALGSAGQYSVVVTDRNGLSFTSPPVNVTVTFPALNLAPAPGALSLTWPADATNYLLQSAPDLGGPWSDMPVAGTNWMSLQTTNPARFYRLHSN